VELVNAGRSVVAADEVLDETTRRFEKLELSLRTSRGVPAGALDLDAEELSGLVEVRDGNAVLTRAGRLLANEISTRLLS
jgi:oxygen-independent coproporphyrinogen-3 oxidase